jgi:site-specific DNA recombinase
MKTKSAPTVGQRAVIYYRVSHADQDDKSQLRELRDYAKANHFQIVREVSEGQAWTGSDSERPAWIDIISRAEDPKRRDFDFLLTTELDRLGRNKYTIQDIGDLVDVNVHVIFTRDRTDTRDDSSEFMLGIKAYMATAYVKSVSAHTRAKMIDRAKQKLATTRPPFGYRVAIEGGSMQTVHGAARLVGASRTYVIDADAAPWVRSMFDWFVAGDSTITIAAKLNEAGAPSPRGRGWIGSSVAAVIDNTMYLGQIIFNKSKWVARSRKQRRAAGLGRRKRVENDPKDWIRQDAPELRIITDDVWQAAQARRAATNRRWHASLKEPREESRGRPTKQLFQLRCGVCGGTFTKANGHKLGCSKHLNSRGTGCSMNALAGERETNAALISLVKNAVLSPDMVKLFAAEVAAESARDSAAPKATAASIKRKQEKAEKEISNLVDAIASYGLRDNLDVQRRLKEATAARDAAVVELSQLQTGSTASEAISATADDLRAMLDRLVGGTVDDPTVVYKARGLLAELVEPFDAFVHAEGTEFRAKLRIPTARKELTPGGFVVPTRSSKFVGNLVAGAGFEPATFGL